MWGLKGLGSGSRRPRSYSVAALAAAAVLAGNTGTARAAEIFDIGLPLDVTSILQDGTGNYVILGEETFSLIPCDTPEGLCLQTAAPTDVTERVPSGALPDGYVAIARTGDIRNAWYGQPTDRYKHGVLGDEIEGGSLIVIGEDGRKSEFVLPEDKVFEDITPRIHDLDGDGTNEVIAIRSSQTGGSAVALYGLREGELVELGAGSENGSPNRWLNIAGIIDGDDGKATVYAVRTPHIGGRLFSLSFANGEVTESGTLATDVSNHVIGSRVLDMSATGDLGTGVELVIPSQDRTALRFPLSGRPNIGLPAPVDKAIIIAEGRIVTSTSDGSLLIVIP